MTAAAEVTGAGQSDLSARVALRATGLLRTFTDAGVLHAADVHVAARLGHLCGEGDETAQAGCGAPGPVRCTRPVGARRPLDVHASMVGGAEREPGPRSPD